MREDMAKVIVGRPPVHDRLGEAYDRRDLYALRMRPLGKRELRRVDAPGSKRGKRRR